MQDLFQRDFLSLKNLDLNQKPSPNGLTEGYSLVLVQSGEGYYMANENQFAYRPGDIILLVNRNTYSFQIGQPTSVYWLSFSSLAANNLLPTNVPGWAFLSQSASVCHGPLATDATDRATLQVLMAILLAEERSLRPFTDNPVVDGLLKTLFSLIDRLFIQQDATAATQPTYSWDIIRRVIAYISQYIGEPNRLRIDSIASEFNYSPSHLSALFRQQVGDSIQQFIIRHKLKLVAQRLRHTSLTVSQIADEFGFTDVCHLNKQFKRQFNHSPTIYRQANL